ncbi:MAG: tRNA (N(6)-L-threonylcarbamoyladenosine(37)-C(2))-methylthiotransferase MtaB [Bacilli bacterium]|jgi:threonylcarbamoyladenosine tRNA methylthiotransferase MtaB|nr:tRNA (N(6)-L-threonylcarbamoyladenosine(37)-C(2))-methylthiotransferase MtaB [Bacilli bacterium]
MTFTIITLGCKVNIYESEMMRERLEKAGYHYQKENPDITIINTCSVTNMADKKSEKMVRQAKKNNPHTILIVAGCSSENKRIKYQDFDIDILLGNKDKSKIVDLLKKWEQTKQKITQFYSTRELPFENMTIEEFHSHTRAFLKIQDGCNNFCSYCIIPYVRGTARSKDFQETLKEAKKIAQKHKEIVLTGIHTGSYFTTDGHDLTDLIHEMSKIDELKRIRISSIEITELNEKFMTELKQNSKICNHLHIPLQAGSDEILTRMNRKYDLNYFENKIKQIRKIRPQINISTDIIVGHPFETDELFEQTLKIVKKLQFTKIHAFPYSKREGTKSASMEHQIDNFTKKERNQRLIALSNQLERVYASSFNQQIVEVLVEEQKDAYSIGHTSNYLKIKIYESLTINQIYQVKLTNLENDVLIGSTLKTKSNQ